VRRAGLSVLVCPAGLAVRDADFTLSTANLTANLQLLQWSHGQRNSRSTFPKIIRSAMHRRYIAGADKKNLAPAS